MSDQVRGLVSNCEIWAEFQARNQIQPLQTHEIAETIEQSSCWSVHTLKQELHLSLQIAIDLVEVSELPDNTSETVIQFFREQSGRNSIPNCLMGIIKSSHSLPPTGSLSM